MLQTIEYKNPKLDRSRWRAGIWDNEPDKKQWQDPATSLACLIVRNHFGNLCGYVGVPKTHKLYGIGYGAAPDVSVHGGLTFANKCAEGQCEEGSICHLAPEGEDDVWWFGFDCAHAGDMCPERNLSSLGETYRDFAYVTAEVTALAAQLHTPRDSGSSGGDR